MEVIGEKVVGNTVGRPRHTHTRKEKMIRDFHSAVEDTWRNSARCHTVTKDWLDF